MKPQRFELLNQSVQSDISNFKTTFNGWGVKRCMSHSETPRNFYSFLQCLQDTPMSFSRQLDQNGEFSPMSLNKNTIRSSIELPFGGTIERLLHINATMRSSSELAASMDFNTR